MKAKKTPVDDGEILWGAAAIARALGKPTKAAEYLIERKLIPFKKVGSRIVTTRTALIAAMTPEV